MVKPQPVVSVAINLYGVSFLNQSSAVWTSYRRYSFSSSAMLRQRVEILSVTDGRHGFASPSKSLDDCPPGHRLDAE